MFGNEGSSSPKTSPGDVSSGSRSRWWRRGLILFVVLLPAVIHQIYGHYSGLPASVVIATGPPGGRYRAMSVALADEISRLYGIEVTLIHTDGSEENLELLRNSDADFGLYQQSSWETMMPGDGEGVEHVANLYLEPAHLIVRSEADIVVASDLDGHRVNLGPKRSGDYQVSRFVLSHLGLSEERVIGLNLPPEEIPAAFSAGELDGAIITMGMSTPVFKEIFRSGRYRLLDVPYRDALVMNHFFLSLFDIPAGSYASQPHAIPERAVQTVATTAQLLTRAGARTALVEALTRLVHDHVFQKKNALRGLFLHGKDFSGARAQFPVHRGALAFYEPELRPLVNPDFVEATEGMRSFLVSLAVAGFLLFGWVKKRRILGRRSFCADALEPE